MVVFLARWCSLYAFQVLALHLLTVSNVGSLRQEDTSATPPTSDASSLSWPDDELELSTTTVGGDSVEPDEWVTGSTVDFWSPKSVELNESSSPRVEFVNGRFRKHINELKMAGDRLDIVFLIDASSSVGPSNFLSELRFVKKLLADLDVSMNRTRVAVVTFSSRTKVMRHVDQISNPQPANDKCLLLNYQLPVIEYSGGGTYTYGALREAEAIFEKSTVSGGPANPRTIFLITDGYSNGPSPIPVAQRLQSTGVTMFAIGIESGNDAELASLVTSPEHRYLLTSFEQFETLVRQALHHDYRPGPSLPVANATLCDTLCESGSCCDVRAVCSCSSTSGHYRCACEPGYGGSGLRGQCQPCPVGTFWVAGGQCEPCRSSRHITLRPGATSERDCVCPHGYQENEDGRCVAITCPKLRAPEHGYFVMDPKPCGQVLNAACGTRCRPGYELTGSSIRLCQENGEWSGTEVKCTMKKCPPLSIPYYGMAVCSNPDLDLFYDYTPRNKSFLQNYSVTAERLTVAMPIDTECAFKCGQGFYLKGSHNRYCLPLSKWDGLQTTCTQILCPALPKVAFGTYDPTDCAEAKSAFGANCTLVCDFGFEMKGGPSTKQCGGRRTGVWSKTKTPRCIDIVPPYIECPGNYTVLLDDDYPYAVVRRLQQPYVFDNSGDNYTYWSKPALKDGGSRLPLGDHQFTYVAVDAFKNKARCSFTVSVIDQTPPVLEQCVDPPVQYISDASNPQELLVQWDEPVVYDNAGSDNVTLTVSHSPGYLAVGVHHVLYRAVDTSGNEAECTVKVEVRQYNCEGPIPAPAHGVSVCAQNTTHVWCELSCIGEYAFHDRQDGGAVRMVCERARPTWGQPLAIPECSETVHPVGVEKVLTIRLDGAPDPSLCGDKDAQGEVSEAFTEGLRDAMCEGQEECTLLATVPFCSGTIDTPTTDDSMRYRIVRRSVVPTEDDADTSSGATVKVVVYKRISQQLGMWRPDGKQSENIRRIKEELDKINANKKLRRRLGTLNLDLSVLKLDEKIRCANGSIARKLVCVHCPRGTYHNHTTNSCSSCPLGTYNEQTGQSSCLPCPKNHSTRRLGSKHSVECKPQCPPGTVAKLKPAKSVKAGNRTGGAGTTRYHKTLMPFCRQCEPGYFQGQYNRAQCQPCPVGHSSARGSTRVADCFQLPEPGSGRPCENGTSLCGPNGRCVVDPAVAGGYECACEGHAVGAHCERTLDACASAPCFNGGQCRVRGTGGFECVCVPPHTGGPLCEQYVDPCRVGWCENGGSCVETEGRAVCECAVGFEGARCEHRKDFCETRPCESEGMCVNVGEGYKCVCPRGKTGRRCQLEPCDYMPCPSGALCRHGDDDDQLLIVLQGTSGVNHSSPVFSASYRCVCPAGLRDVNCTVVDNPCETTRRDYCRNGGTCQPVKLRKVRAPSGEDYDSAEEDDEEAYRAVRCHCPPGYYGDRCERHPSVDLVLHFPPGMGVHTYAKVVPTAQDVTAYRAMAVCGWYQTDDDFNYGALVSYATAREDNALTLTDYSGLVVYVNGAHVVTNVSLNDGEWHFLCLCWTSDAGGRYELFLDGELRAAGTNLSAGVPVPAGGLLVLGQEQDRLGGGFSETESYRGRMAYVDVWTRALPASEVRHLYHTCEPYHGDLVRWTDAKLHTVGAVRMEPSGFCRSCPRNHSLPNGSVRYDMARQQAHFQCDEGYELIGPPSANCLRTSRWTVGSRFCKLIRCGTVGAPTNGQVVLSKTSYGGEARFSCDEGFVLAGLKILHCTTNATWSGPVPECISILKCIPLALDECSGVGAIIYATERGPIGRTQPAYDVGVLAEVRCAPGFTLEGDNLLTCDEGGQWDLPLPACLPPTVPTQTTPASLIIRVSRRPDVHFWKGLKDYLLHGCFAVRPVSPFCHLPEAGGNWSDLQGFSVQRESDQGSSIDVKLLSFLMRSVRTHGNTSSERLTPNSLLPYILYGSLDTIAYESRFPPPVEDVYRFVICQFIDVILMDRELNYDGELEVDIALEENTNVKIKYLLKHVVQPLHRQYQQWEEERSAREAAALRKIIGLAPELPTPAPPKRCPVRLLPTPPIDGRVVAVDLQKVRVPPTTGTGLEGLHHSELLADVGDRVRYGCVEGFSMRGSGVSECGTDGRWTLPDGFCEGALCEDPPVRANMHIAPESLDTHYYVDDEIEFRCAAGYAIKGHPIIKCQHDGRWTPILSRCTRISCGRPKIPQGAKILSGNSFFFGDALTVRCHQRTVDIVCQATGQWTPLDEC
ncbi:sushi, von Willebrand factor type A, EGF and pentraxin domain-containing protein 1-like [Anopheles ziemanni]|uniref:sushi, von Willebrand factor type A, EGF and pentraxin domain-containing protein 1-like n=1 Tax=Anopheles coustani TaxID=139045 RepID=UPI00265AC509|nr:sushi, von Willebrand factor type A, EGF and pentraxin domain-containing protein 1-like [Anopheles coustani]XP_058175828.1 sushi, von Willebrand factor type A, EGF and pentraxin domain-containing protein 1-like [Anopheles ziemanni]